MRDPKVIGKLPGKGHTDRELLSSWRQARKEDGNVGQVALNWAGVTE